MFFFSEKGKLFEVPHYLQQSTEKETYDINNVACHMQFYLKNLFKMNATTKIMKSKFDPTERKKMKMKELIFIIYTQNSTSITSENKKLGNKLVLDLKLLNSSFGTSS